MRVIGGKNKGKKLKSFDGQDIRPTADRAKEALFNILGDKVLACDFLDLCSGTGSIGIESYSRGANSVTFVDASAKSIKLTKDNALSVGLQETFIQSTAKEYLLQADKQFDIIFFDPPYAFMQIEEILKVVKDKNLLKDDGLFIYERPCKNQVTAVCGFEILQSRKYGIATFDFYRREEL